jgi:plasmid stabilization system protein ParE
MLRVVVHPDAERELQAAADWYESQQAGLGVRFLTQVDQAVADIRERPTAWAGATQGCRRRLVRRFPYGLIYRVHPDRIHLLAVMHLHQAPGYWQGRR